MALAEGDLSSSWLPLGIVGGGAVLALGLLLPGPYWSLFLWSLSQQAILALSYNFLGGMARQIHLGHGAFFGLGAYTSAMCIEAQLPWWVGILAGGSSGVLAARGLAPLLMRLKGTDFALSSLCIALLGGILARNLEPLTGGVSGLCIHVSEREIPYLGTLALLLGTVWIHHTLLAAPWGRALRAGGSDPLAAAHLGVPCPAIRTEALVLGSAIASLAGGIYPLQSGYVSPESAFGAEVLLSPVVAVMLGGPGSVWGPVVGAVLTATIQEFLLTQLRGGNLLVFGLFLLASGLRPSTDEARAPRAPRGRCAP